MKTKLLPKHIAQVTALALLTCAPLTATHAGLFGSFKKFVDDTKDAFSSAAHAAADAIAQETINTANEISGGVEEVADDIEDVGKDIEVWFDAATTEVGEIVDYIEETAKYYEFYEQVSDVGTHSSYSQSYTLTTSTQASAQSGSFNILTYNMRGFPDALDGISNNETRQVGTWIENDWQPDIVALQEDWVKHDLLLENITQTSYPYRTDHYDGGSLSLGDGLATLSKFPFDNTTSARVRFEKCYGTLWQTIIGEYFSPDCVARKGFTRARMVIDNDFELDVYNLHQNTGKQYGTNSANMAQLANYINTYSKDRPILIAGDWNSTIETNPFVNRKVRDTWIQELVDATGISFACMDITHALDPTITDTYPDDYAMTDYAKCNLDVVAYRGNSQFSLTPVSRVEVDDQDQSDHRPTLVTFDWQRHPLATGSTQNVSHNWKATTPASSDCAASQFIGNISSYEGADSGVLRMTQIDSTCYVRYQEETSKNDETDHDSAETVDLLSLKEFSNSALAAYGEAGTLNTVSSSNTIVQLNRSYTNPVIFASISTYNGGDPATIKLSNITADAFTIAVQEFDFDDFTHTDEQIHYLVMEAGTYLLDNAQQVVVSAQTISTTMDGFPNFTAINTDLDNYKLFTQIQSTSHNTTLATRSKKNASDFAISLMVQESLRNNDQTYTANTGYMLIGDTSGLRNETTSGVTDAWKDVLGGCSNCADAIVLSNVSSYAGIDSGVLRMRDNNGVLQAKFHEDNTNGETVHKLGEKVDMLMLDNFESSALAAFGEVGVVNAVNANGKDISIHGNYTNPVIFTTITSYNGADLVTPTVSLANDYASFRLAVQEFDYDDGAHVNEQVHYLVIEAGTYTLNNGQTVTVGTEAISTTMDGSPNFTAITTSLQDFRVFTQTQTNSSAVTLATRTKRSSGNFSVSLMPQNSFKNNGNTYTETVGYLMIGE